MTCGLVASASSEQRKQKERALSVRRTRARREMRRNLRRPRCDPEPLSPSCGSDEDSAVRGAFFEWPTFGRTVRRPAREKCQSPLRGDISHTRHNETRVFELAQLARVGTFNGSPAKQSLISALSRLKCAATSSESWNASANAMMVGKRTRENYYFQKSARRLFGDRKTALDNNAPVSPPFDSVHSSPDALAP